MKYSKSSLLVGMTAGVLALFISADLANAQVPAPVVQRPQSEILRIRKVTDISKDYQQKTPVFTSGGRSVKERTWGVFDVAPEWIDEMRVVYTVLLLNPKPRQGEKPMSLFQVTSSYADIAQGRDRKMGVVLLPAALERFGRPIGFAAQIFVNGNPVDVAQVAVENSLKSVEKWWENPTIIDHPNVERRSGYLLERSKSIFSLVDIDSYEASR